MSAPASDHRARPTIGYALGGGAVRGAAHIGFLSVFEQAGITPDFIAGTSAGAVVGAGYAAGLAVAEMSRLAGSTSWRDVTDVAWKQRMSLFDTTPLMRWIQGAIGDIDFSDLRIPLAAVACNIIDGHRVVLRDGSVVFAAVASSTIPGLFNPLPLDDKLLVDGGLVENLPVSVARDMGADIVVAVDVSPALRQGLRPRNLPDIVSATATIAARNTQVAARMEADFLVEPDVEQFQLWDFTQSAEIEEAGRVAAQRVVGDVLAVLEQARER